MYLLLGRVLFFFCSSFLCEIIRLIAHIAPFRAYVSCVISGERKSKNVALLDQMHNLKFNFTLLFGSLT